MKSGYTHVSMLLDRSGSMQSIKDDTIGGVNTFIGDQKKEPGEMTFTLCQFDTEYDTVDDFKKIQDVPPLTDKTFVPRGNTALLDSACKLIIETGARLAALSEESRPEKVMIVIVTDGQENASKEQTRKSLAAMVKTQTEHYKWHFIYIGANQDSFSEAHAIGMQGVNYRASSVGTRAAFSSLSANVARNRGADDYAPLSQKDIDKQEGI